MPRRNGLRNFAFHREENAASPGIALSLAASPGDGRAPAVNLAAMEPERAALLQLQNALRSDKLPELTAPEVDGDVAEFKAVGHQRLLLTNSQTVKFRQFHRKIPVYGSLITVEMDTRNRLLSINSSVGEPTGVEAVASIAPAAALEAARKDAGLGASDKLDAQPRLNFYFDNGAGRWRLVYILEDVPRREEGDPDDDHHLPQVYDYIVDAHSGEVVAFLPRTQTIEPFLEVEAADALAVPRKFRCSDLDSLGRCLADPEANIHTHDFAFRSVEGDAASLPGGYVALREPDPWDPAAVSAHANAAEVVAFLERVLMRRGIDGLGGKLVSSVNCVRRPGAREWRNAAWYRGQMVYGQREVGGVLRSYAVARDVVAHEIFHGVTEATSRLEYSGESGALNESYSDIFGILIGNAHEPDLGRWNWEIGEELDGTGLPLRDVSDPERCGQPAHMRDYHDLPLTAQGDWGGVHINSGIHNKAAHNLLLAGIDRVAVARLFFVTLTEQLSRTSGFSDSRRGLELVARSLFRTDPDRNDKLAAVAKAFDDVGIER